MTELTSATSASTVRKAWTDALVSGKYAQGDINLHKVTKTGESFCCFGVLCDLAVKAGVIPEPTVLKDFYISGETVYQYGPDSTNHYHLTDTVRRWAGFEGDDFFVADLEELNDSGKSFETIAKIIEEQTF